MEKFANIEELEGKKNRSMAIHNGKIVAKFGGSSLSGPDQFKKVKQIIESDDRRSCIVVSAPGKRFDSDTKITDLLIELYQLQLQKEQEKIKSFAI